MRDDKPKPKFEYDGALRSKGYDKPPSNEGITIIRTGQLDAKKKVWCPECKHSMRLVAELECYICNYDHCGNIIQIKLGGTPLHEEQVLHTANDPYAEMAKPIFTHLNPVYPEEYEDFGTQIYETAEEAMAERRIKRDGKKAQSQQPTKRQVTGRR